MPALSEGLAGHPDIGNSEHSSGAVIRDGRKTPAREKTRSRHVSAPAAGTAASPSQEAAASSLAPQTPGGDRRSPLPVAPPASNQDLIFQMWDSLTWSKTGQASVLIIVSGIAATLVFATLGLLAHALIGIPAIWSAIGSASVGAATITYTGGRVRRRRKQPRAR